MLELINKQKIFEKYPEVVTVAEMRKMLGGKCKDSALKLLHNKEIQAIKVDRVWRIPKESVIDYLIKEIKATYPEIPETFFGSLK